ncbi:FAD-linked oxidoreductase chyH [Cladobotryum mycophilum]|uniref:FAD-linked oxidoreductase chyH n=1 Tax=Cladobotryum mycophilum TaxID=491253 RepID=A0ABR0T085_9HYPO
MKRPWISFSIRTFALVVQLFPRGAFACTQTVHDVFDERCGIGTNIMQSLRPLLSSEAVITYSSSPNAEALLARASAPRVSPEYVAIVEVASESDIQQTVKYANRHGMPFLAVSGGHGWPSSLNRMKGGIQINMRKLNTTKLKPDGTTVIVGGGTLQHEITASMFKEHKQVVTGLCGCTSVVGPLLGGGHSMLQYRHGFAADNLVSARVVLADGEVVDVSAENNPDLFWALRGAGHNFGIVSAAEIKVYEAEETWGMSMFIFAENTLEQVFETWNRVETLHPDPGMLVLNGYITRIEEVDPKHPLLLLQLFYAEVDNTIVGDFETSFLELNPLSHSITKNIPWGDIFDVGGMGITSPVCLKNRNLLGSPTSAHQWNPVAMRKGFELLSEITADKAFSTSVIIVESYGSKGIRAVPVSENAVAPEEREYHIRLSPILWWTGDDEENTKKAERFAKDMQSAMRDDKIAPHMYVNYATGHEKMEEVYGYDQQRIAKLKTLKKAWDPHNRFGFYMPIG